MAAHAGHWSVSQSVADLGAVTAAAGNARAGASGRGECCARAAYHGQSARVPTVDTLGRWLPSGRTGRRATPATGGSCAPRTPTPPAASTAGCCPTPANHRLCARATVKLGGRPFGELRPALALRDDVRENGGALDDVRALPTKRRTSRAAAAPVGRWDILLGQRRVPPYAARRRFTRRVSVRSGRPKGKARRSHSLPLITYSAPGGLPQDPGRTAESSVEATTCGNGGTTCVCCCRRVRDAVTSDRWWDWRCGCGRSARRCGCARRPTGRSGRPTRQREGNER
jgi:hypothetical protein